MMGNPLNPLLKYCMIEADIIIIEPHEHIHLVASTHDRLAVRIIEWLDQYPQHKCVILVGGVILSDKEVERLREVKDNDVAQPES